MPLFLARSFVPFPLHPVSVLVSALTVGMIPIGLKLAPARQLPLFLQEYVGLENHGFSLSMRHARKTYKKQSRELQKGLNTDPLNAKTFARGALVTRLPRGN